MNTVRAEMDRLTGEILRHQAAHPDDFDGREQLWMQREQLRAELAELDRPVRTAAPQRRNTAILWAAVPLLAAYLVAAYRAEEIQHMHPINSTLVFAAALVALTVLRRRVT